MIGTSRSTVTAAWPRSPEATVDFRVSRGGASTAHLHAVIHPTVGAKEPQLTVTIRHAPDPTRPAATTNPKNQTRSTTTATATNSHSDPTAGSKNPPDNTGGSTPKTEPTRRHTTRP